jgi:hypothetical protein
MNEELKTKIEKLCKDLETTHFQEWPSLKDYGVTYKAGRKFVKIIITDANGGDRSVWGFINLTHDKFKTGDVLKAAGWAAPALNHARGNIVDGYSIDARRMYGPNYMFEGVK